VQCEIIRQDWEKAAPQASSNDACGAGVFNRGDKMIDSAIHHAESILDALWCNLAWSWRKLAAAALIAAASGNNSDGYGSRGPCHSDHADNATRNIVAAEPSAFLPE
jgi:hypothetical protein